MARKSKQADREYQARYYRQNKARIAANKKARLADPNLRATHNLRQRQYYGRQTSLFKKEIHTHCREHHHGHQPSDALKAGLKLKDYQVGQIGQGKQRQRIYCPLTPAFPTLTGHSTELIILPPKSGC